MLVVFFIFCSCIPAFEELEGNQLTLHNTAAVHSFPISIRVIQRPVFIPIFIFMSSRMAKFWRVHTHVNVHTITHARSFHQRTLFFVFLTNMARVIGQSPLNQEALYIGIGYR